MITITRGYRFSASHRLHLDSLTEQENEALYGKCNNPFGHGHNYRLEVTVSGPVHQLTGQMLPIAQLDQLVAEKVLSEIDHRYINVDLPEFKRLVPTTENLVAVVAGRLQKYWADYIVGTVQLIKIYIQETDRNGFELTLPYSPAQAAIVPNSETKGIWHD